MTRQGRRPDPREAASRRYSSAFPGQELPVLHGVGSQGGEASEVAVVMLGSAAGGVAASGR